MLFTELRFAVFFVAIFAVYWALRSNVARKAWLLLASYAFYAAWDWRFVSLIAFSTAINFAVGAALARLEGRGARRAALAVSLVVSLGILGFFKYYNFFADSAATFSQWLGLPLSVSQLEIVLPVGISFYTFQALSYTIDVYRRRLEPSRSPLDFALFVAFFPQLVAGPIVRAARFLPQLALARRFAEVNLRFHLTLFLVGYVKKACVADQVARVVDPVFANPELYGAASKWLASCLYTLQIYCDFSGYTDMAVACAGLLGYRLAENFDFPYLTRSFRDYWRRWHISLSSWFRDYLFIPLGGSQRSPGRVAFNLLLVFFLCGLWHGAAWTVVLWGLYQGAFISAERWLAVDRLPRWLGHLYLLFFTNLGFVLFRSADLPSALAYLSGLVSPGAAAAGIAPWWWLLLLGFASVHCWGYRKPVEERVGALPAPIFAVGFGAAVALALAWAAAGYQPFIYFQF